MRIKLSPPDVTELEERYVLDAMRSGWVAPAGPDLTSFECEIADRAQVQHAVGLSSGTAALHLALVSWGVGVGDVVPVSTLTFAASVNAIRYVGAEPFFVDCDPESGNMDPDLLAASLTQLGSAGRRVPVVIAVDMLGKCVDYAKIEQICLAAGVLLLCDSAESFGAKHQGLPAGSFGHASVLSFNGNKIMTTSGGGMLLTNDENLALHARKLATQSRENVLHYEHTELGYNYRLSNVLAALGRAQLVRLDDMLARRREWREKYREIFAAERGVRILGGEFDSEDNCWLTAIIVDSSVCTWTLQDLVSEFSMRQIEVRPVWKPMHLQPVFAEFEGLLTGSAECLFDQGVTLPSGSGMSDTEFAEIVEAISVVTSQ